MTTHPDIRALRDRAQAGDLRALTSLGKRLVMGIGVAASLREGVACLTRAASQGDAEATAELALYAAFGVARTRDVDQALDLLQRAAELGWEPSQRQLRFLSRREGTHWADLRGQVDVGSWTMPPPLRVVSESPLIRVCERFASHAECDWLINLARHDLERALIYRKDAAGHVPSDTRTNTEANYTIGNCDIVMSLVNDRLAAATGVQVRFFEVAKLLHYEPGQQFALHCDFQEPITPALRREVEEHGQRVATVLVYLNDDYTGGETDFPRIRLRHKGARGDALLFSNVRPNGALDYDTLHAGLPPTSGEKWVFSQWIRDRPVRD